MKKLLIITALMIRINAIGQKDSTMITVLSGNGAHNGYCCGHYSDTAIMHWSWKRKEWCMLTDSLYDAYYGRYSPDIKQLEKQRDSLKNIDRFWPWGGGGFNDSTIYTEPAWGFRTETWYQKSPYDSVEFGIEWMPKDWKPRRKFSYYIDNETGQTIEIKHPEDKK